MVTSASTKEQAKSHESNEAQRDIEVCAKRETCPGTPTQAHTHTLREREAYVCVCVACGAGAKAISVLKLLHKLAVLAALPGLSGLSTAFWQILPHLTRPPPPRIFIFWHTTTTPHMGRKAANTLPLTVAGFSAAVAGGGRGGGTAARGGRAVCRASCWKITLYNLCG